MIDDGAQSAAFRVKTGKLIVQSADLSWHPQKNGNPPLMANSIFLKTPLPLFSSPHFPLVTYIALEQPLTTDSRHFCFLNLSGWLINTSSRSIKLFPPSLIMRRVKIFSGTSHPSLTEAICERLGTTPGKCDLKKFSNGETSVDIGCSIRDQDVFIVQSGSAK